jgi:Ca2+:H+ antiporter
VQQAAITFGMTSAFVGFIVVALVGAAAEMASAFSAARKNRLDLSVSIALGSAAQIALFVAPVLVLLSYVIGPTPMDLQFWPGAVVMMLIATMTASLVTNSGRSAWFVGVLVLMVYLIFAMTLYLLPPKSSSEGTVPKKTTERSIQRAFEEVKFTSLGGIAPERSACCASFS